MTAHMQCNRDHTPPRNQDVTAQDQDPPEEFRPPIVHWICYTRSCRYHPHLMRHRILQHHDSITLRAPLSLAITKATAASISLQSTLQSCTVSSAVCSPYRLTSVYVYGSELSTMLQATRKRFIGRRWVMLAELPHPSR